MVAPSVPGGPERCRLQARPRLASTGGRLAACDPPRVASVGLGGALAGPYLERLMAEASPSTDLARLARFLARAARKRRAKPADGTSYQDDFYLWANEQAEHLRRGNWSRLDALNLAEEIEDLGREVYNELESRFRIILLHLLKMGSPAGTANKKLDCFDQGATDRCGGVVWEASQPGAARARGHRRGLPARPHRGCRRDRIGRRRLPVGVPLLPRRDHDPAHSVAVRMSRRVAR